jgi:hypothetical protein
MRGCGAWVDGISDSTRCIPEVEHPWIGPFETLKEAFTDCIKIRARSGRRRDLEDATKAAQQCACDTY